MKTQDAKKSRRPPTMIAKHGPIHLYRIYPGWRVRTTTAEVDHMRWSLAFKHFLRAFEEYEGRKIGSRYDAYISPRNGKRIS